MGVPIACECVCVTQPPVVSGACCWLSDEGAGIFSCEDYVTGNECYSRLSSLQQELHLLQLQLRQRLH